MTTGLLDITVTGKPQPQGSVKAFVPQHKGGAPVRRPDGSIVVNLISDNPALKAWREQIADLALATTGDVATEPVVVEATFWLERPKAHHGTGRNEGIVKDSAPAYPSTRPDVDKLLRAVLDALTDVAWLDDSQVVEALARKRYADAEHPPGVRVSVFAASARTALEASPQLALA